MTFDKKLLEESINLIFEDKFQALYIPEVVLGKGFFGKIMNFERSFYSETPIDAVRVVKKEIFNKVGGYDEKNIIFGADDWDLTKSIRKITNKISITKNKLYHHEESLDWKTFLIKKGKYVNCFDGYIKKWGKDYPDVKKQLGLWYRSVVVFTEEGKWRQLITHPILTMSMYLSRFLTWLSYKMNQ